MGSKKVLYISGSIGLGHAARDLAIANELRRQDPGIEIMWLAGDPARRLIDTITADQRIRPQGRCATRARYPVHRTRRRQPVTAAAGRKITALRGDGVTLVEAADEFLSTLNVEDLDLAEVTGILAPPRRTH